MVIHYQLKLYKNEKHSVFNRRNPCNWMDIGIFCLSRWRRPYPYSFSNCRYCFTFRDHQEGVGSNP